MKLMIASDLHGSGYYVKKLVDAFQAEGAEKLLLLGDLLYHGPRNHLPEEYDCPTVAQQLNAMKDKIIAVRRDDLAAQRIPRDPEQMGAAHILVRLCKQLLADAALVRRQPQQGAVVKGDIQILGKALADHPAAAAIFPGDGNYKSFHAVPSFRGGYSPAGRARAGSGLIFSINAFGGKINRRGVFPVRCSVLFSSGIG